MKKNGLRYLFVTLCFFIFMEAQNQDYYYSSEYSPTNDQETARYKRSVRQRSSGKIVITSFIRKDKHFEKTKKDRIRQKSDTLMTLSSKGEGILPQTTVRSYYLSEDGLFHFKEYIQDELSREGTATQLIPLHLQDTVISYYSNNKLKSISIFDNNRMLSNSNWLPNGNAYYSDLFYFVDKTPEHSNGQVFFRQYMLNGLYKTGIDLSQISDRVTVGWVVLEDGSIDGFHILTGVYKPLNEAIIQLISELPGEWIPAKLHGKPVRYYMTMPFNFLDRSENFESLELTGGFMVWD